MAAPNIEHRMATGLQASGRTLTGYAAVFNADTRVGDFIERIAPGAFIRSLESGRDVLALADHDPKSVLGRTSSGTLALSEDSHGLAFTLTLPDTTAGRDLAALAARGDAGRHHRRRALRRNQKGHAGIGRCQLPARRSGGYGYFPVGNRMRNVEC